ncbi:Protein ALP1-like [Frankliniella fusca]|uniref:Protein ALP1-like n=1 Tax=Frankliniella fusca TaxID=407009 RepID=A0AAE1GVN4_9NEOP|nr:Protein ALP1-like [Frankliniella fusca]
MASRPNILKIVKYYCLLNAELDRQGRPLSEWKRSSLKRIIAYNLYKRLVSHAKLRAALLSRRRIRRWHVRPIFRDRKLYGAWFTLIPIMRQSDPEEFYRFLRMTPACFDWLLNKVQPYIQKKSNRVSVSAGERLAVTLRYLASGDSQTSLSYLFRLSNQAISKIVTETTAAIWYKFPMRGSEFYNYKGTHSIILFAVADAKYKFIVADAGARGREGDSGVFSRSDFGKLFLDQKLALPPSVYNHTLKCYLPYVFVGDGAFPLNEHLLKPYEPGKKKDLKDEEVIFNYRLSRARRVVENSFGILSARFRILRHNSIASETLAQNIILSTCALHNLHLIREDSLPPQKKVYLPPGFTDSYRSNGVFKAGRWRKKVPTLENTIFRNLMNAEESCPSADSDPHHPALVRDNFMDLFLVKSLPWQWKHL